MFKKGDDSPYQALFDFAFALAGCFLLSFVLVVPFIGSKKDDNPESRRIGNVIIDLYWDDSINTDIDLWGQAPCPKCKGGRDKIVGYSNTGGVVFNLIRDDTTNDPGVDASGKNMETVLSRGIVPGEYIANVHLYRLGSAKLPLVVRVVGSVKKDASTPAVQLFAINVELFRECQEKTAARFSLDAQGNLVKDSLHFVKQNLRSHKSCAASES